MSTSARKRINEKIASFAKLFKDNDRVLFVGVNPDYDYKPLFKCEYLTLDIKEKMKPDIIADIQACPQIASNSFDGVIMAGVYEYLNEPEKAISEIYRLLKVKGKTLFCFPEIGYYSGKKPSVKPWEVSEKLEPLTTLSIDVISYRGTPNYINILACKEK